MTKKKWHKRLLRVLLLFYSMLWFIALFNYNERVVYSIPDVWISSSMQGSKGGIMLVAVDNKYCRVRWEELKLHTIRIHHSPSIGETKSDNPDVEPGGQWHPKKCVPFQKVAIIIPYRQRWYHLRLLLSRLHPMLQRQRIDYRVFVVEQLEGTPFNRGMLMNVGVNEALKIGNFDCFVFHDVDLIPEHDRNIYLCDDHVRHLSSAIDEMRYHVTFDNYVGGVVALARENVFKVNGYSNSYWGWGNEDDDFSARTLASGLKLSRPPEHIGRYKMVRHKKADRSDSGYPKFLSWRARQYKDGLNSLSPSTYHVNSITGNDLYTNVSVVLNNSWKSFSDKKYKSMESVLWFLKFYGWLL